MIDKISEAKIAIHYHESKIAATVMLKNLSPEQLSLIIMQLDLIKKKLMTRLEQQLPFNNIDGDSDDNL